VKTPALYSLPGCQTPGFESSADQLAAVDPTESETGEVAASVAAVLKAADLTIYSLPN